MLIVALTKNDMLATNFVYQLHEPARIQQFDNAIFLDVVILDKPLNDVHVIEWPKRFVVIKFETVV